LSSLPKMGGWSDGCWLKDDIGTRTHIARYIGASRDTPSSVTKNVQILQDTFEAASIMILTILTLANCACVSLSYPIVEVACVCVRASVIVISEMAIMSKII
jgi:hypothetical protein